jgi:NAD(P)-dependent dehydrogenase (short-subunit alcohol dehydrogenase family)
MADKVRKDVGDVDILINNAGIVTGGAISSCPDDKIDLTLKVNLLAHFWVNKIK